MNKRVMLEQIKLVGYLSKGVYNQDSIKGIVKDLDDLSDWAKALGDQFRNAGEDITEIGDAVLPSVGPWIGGILGKLATLKQVKY